MTDKKGQVPERPAEPAPEAEKLTRGVTRFAQYTSPTMLAMLASAGHDVAFAQVTAT